MIGSSHRYRVELMNYLYAIHRKEVVDEQGKMDLEEARRSFTESFAEAQIIAPQEVLATIYVIREGTAKGYRDVKHLEDKDPEPNGSFEEIETFLNGLWIKWGDMRDSMRNDLGIED